MVQHRQQVGAEVAVEVQRAIDVAAAAVAAQVHAGGGETVLSQRLDLRPPGVAVAAHAVHHEHQRPLAGHAQRELWLGGHGDRLQVHGAAQPRADKASASISTKATEAGAAVRLLQPWLVPRCTSTSPVFSRVSPSSITAQISPESTMA